MTESLFSGTEAVDEYELVSTPDGVARVRDHHQNFITEADFRWLAVQGLNAVRIPIGYWLFGDEPPYVAGIERLDWAMEMAAKYGLKVLLCLHGAPGSQNGRDHSGRAGRAKWYTSARYREATIQFLERLATRYADAPALWGIELLNEPKFGIFQVKLRRFYRQAYGRLIKILRPGTHIVFHDAFTPRLMSGALGSVPEYPVVMDIHWYQSGGWLSRVESLARYFRRIARRVGLIQQLEVQQPVVVGEWSVVLSGEVLRRAGGLSEADAVWRHAQLQLGVYAQTHGWFYWTYKTEGRGIWHFRSQVEEGVINL
jgi:glucan 1,3-beta-glucosidase